MSNHISDSATFFLFQPRKTEYQLLCIWAFVNTQTGMPIPRAYSA